jgi:hypothetical protein
MLRALPSCVVTATVLAAAPAFAPSDIGKHPVRFAKVTCGTTITDSLSSNQPVDSTLRAVAEQTKCVKRLGFSTVRRNSMPPGSTMIFGACQVARLSKIQTTTCKKEA